MNFISMLLNMEFTKRQRQDNFKASEMTLNSAEMGRRPPTALLQTINLKQPFTVSDTYFPHQCFQGLRAVGKS